MRRQESEVEAEWRVALEEACQGAGLVLTDSKLLEEEEEASLWNRLEQAAELDVEPGRFSWEALVSLCRTEQSSTGTPESSSSSSSSCGVEDPTQREASGRDGWQVNVNSGGVVFFALFDLDRDTALLSSPRSQQSRQGHVAPPPLAEERRQWQQQQQQPPNLRAAVIKFSASRLATQAEYLGAEVARHLHVASPRVRVVHSSSPEWAAMKYGVQKARAQGEGARDLGCVHACNEVLEAMQLSRCFLFSGRAHARESAPQAFAPGPAAEETARTLGRVLALDMVLRNEDRLPCRQLGWRGNPNNLLYALRGVLPPPPLLPSPSAPAPLSPAPLGGTAAAAAVSGGGGGGGGGGPLPGGIQKGLEVGGPSDVLPAAAGPHSKGPPVGFLRARTDPPGGSMTGGRSKKRPPGYPGSNLESIPSGDSEAHMELVPGGIAGDAQGPILLQVSPNELRPHANGSCGPDTWQKLSKSEEGSMGLGNIVVIDSGICRRPPSGKVARDEEEYSRFVELILNDPETAARVLDEISWGQLADRLSPKASPSDPAPALAPALPRTSASSAVASNPELLLESAPGCVSPPLGEGDGEAAAAGAATERATDATSGELARAQLVQAFQGGVRAAVGDVQKLHSLLSTLHYWLDEMLRGFLAYVGTAVTATAAAAAAAQPQRSSPASPGAGSSSPESRRRSFGAPPGGRGRPARLSATSSSSSLSSASCSPASASKFVPPPRRATALLSPPGGAGSSLNEAKSATPAGDVAAAEEGEEYMSTSGGHRRPDDPADVFLGNMPPCSGSAGQVPPGTSRASQEGTAIDPSPDPGAPRGSSPGEPMVTRTLDWGDGPQESLGQLRESGSALTPEQNGKGSSTTTPTLGTPPTPTPAPAPAPALAPAVTPTPAAAAAAAPAPASGPQSPRVALAPASACKAAPGSPSSPLAQPRCSLGEALSGLTLAGTPDPAGCAAPSDALESPSARDSEARIKEIAAELAAQLASRSLPGGASPAKSPPSLAGAEPGSPPSSSSSSPASSASSASREKWGSAKKEGLSKRMTMKIRGVKKTAAADDELKGQLEWWDAFMRDEGQRICRARGFSTGFLETTGAHSLVDSYELKVRLEHTLERMALVLDGAATERPCQILPTLFVGSALAARASAVLGRLGITHAVTLCQEELLNLPDGKKAHKCKRLLCPVEDTESEDISAVFDRACAYIEEAVAGGGKVLVHCFEGRSRSVTVVIAYLMKAKGLTLKEAWARVKGAHPRASPNDGFMSALLALDASLHGAASIDWKRTRPVAKTCPVCGKPAGLSRESLRVHLRRVHPQHAPPAGAGAGAEAHARPLAASLTSSAALVRGGSLKSGSLRGIASPELLAVAGISEKCDELDAL
eukprot:jgi/Mesen1/3784/ME000205S03042